MDFSSPRLSDFGGLAAIREYERPGNIIDRIVSCIVDLRNQDFVVHTYGEMVRQRVYQIIAGYEDADDCDRLRSDGMIKLCAGRNPFDEVDLASQPTMCRLENQLTKQELHAIGMAFIDNFIASYDSAPELIVLDADDTNANTYGAQNAQPIFLPAAGFCKDRSLNNDGAVGAYWSSNLLYLSEDKDPKNNIPSYADGVGFISTGNKTNWPYCRFRYIRALRPPCDRIRSNLNIYPTPFRRVTGRERHGCS